MKNIHSLATDRRAFTLIEMLAVMMLIVFLTGLIIGAAAFANRKAAISAAASGIEKLRTALEENRLDAAGYPDLDGDPNSIFAISLNQTKCYYLTNYVKDVVFLDPWDRAYWYLRPTPFQCRVWSYGPDGRDGTQDDIEGAGER